MEKNLEKNMYVYMYMNIWSFSGSSDSKESACSAGDPGSIPGLGRTLEKGMTTHSSGCGSLTVKKAVHRRSNAFKLWC